MMLRVNGGCYSWKNSNLQQKCWIFFICLTEGRALVVVLYFIDFHKFSVVTTKFVRCT